MSKKIDLTGMRFGRLTAVRFMQRRPVGKQFQSIWEFRCECGSLIIMPSNRVRCGNTQSCGCLRKELLQKLNLKHGGTGTRTYRIWKGMRQRCNNSNNPNYVNYGERGITVCERWLSFANFLADMGEAPRNMSIDRINNYDNYEPSNCRWADSFQQSQNRRSTYTFVVNGKAKRISEIACDVGIRYTTMYERLIVYGWDLQRAISTPLRKRPA